MSNQVKSGNGFRSLVVMAVIVLIVGIATGHINVGSLVPTDDNPRETLVQFRASWLPGNVPAEAVTYTAGTSGQAHPPQSSPFSYSELVPRGTTVRFTVTRLDGPSIGEISCMMIVDGRLIGLGPLFDEKICTVETVV